MSDPLLVAQSDVEDRFGVERVAQIFSTQSPDGSMSPTATTTAVNAAIRDAGAMFNSMMVDAGYVIPLVSPIPDVVIAIICDLVPWLGIRRRPEFAADKSNVVYLDAFREARATIQKIRDGKQRLNVALVPTNQGGELTLMNPVAAQPKYFEPGDDGTGGFNDSTF